MGGGRRRLHSSLEHGGARCSRGNVWLCLRAVPVLQALPQRAAYDARAALQRLSLSPGLVHLLQARLAALFVGGSISHGVRYRRRSESYCAGELNLGLRVLRVQEHVANCPMVPLTCDKCEAEVSRAEYQAHCAEYCQEAVVACPLGCPATVRIAISIESPRASTVVRRC